jgi:predicted RNase H-like HicB family nuclease
MDGLAACVSVLIQSQVASVAALHGLLSEGQSYGKLRKQLETSLKLVKAAERQLSET